MAMSNVHQLIIWKQMNIVILLAAHWFLSLFCQSFFLHRYCSHRMFKMNIFWERFFYLLTYLTQGLSFLNPSSYSIMHQRHHHFSDTEKDPHSPIQSRSVWKMMVKTYKHYKDLIINHDSVTDKFITNRSPKWGALDRFAESYISILLWSAIYIGIYYSLKIKLIYYIFLPIHFMIGPIQGAIVNWCGHKIGYRNFALNDNSRNTLPMDFALMGELYQNNHHRNGQKINFAHKWFEVDLTYQISRILNILGIIKIEKV